MEGIRVKISNDLLGSDFSTIKLKKWLKSKFIKEWFVSMIKSRMIFWNVTIKYPFKFYGSCV